VVLAWLAALQSSAAQGADAAQRFAAALPPALQPLPAQHPFRAEMAGAEAELLRLQGHTAAAIARHAEASALYRQAIGQALPEGFLVLH